MDRSFAALSLPGRLILTLILVLAWPVASHATTVLRLPFQEVCDQAEFIFEGRVVDVAARVDAEGRYIWTHVVFEIAEAIKGSHSEDRIELKFLGGTVGELALDVGEMHLPRVGDHGIYFVESMRSPLAHPLVGWDQGHYRVEQTPDGGQRMMTANGKFIESIVTQKRGGQEFSAGIAYGVKISDPGLSAGAMPVTDFKVAVRRLAR